MEHHMYDLEQEFSELHQKNLKSDLEESFRKKHLITIFLYFLFQLVPSLIMIAITPLIQDNPVFVVSYTATEQAVDNASYDVNSILIVSDSLYEPLKSQYEGFLFSVYQTDGYSIYMHKSAQFYNDVEFDVVNGSYVLKTEMLDSILAGTKTKWNNNADISVIVPKDDTAPIYLQSEIFDPLDLVQPQRNYATNFTQIFSFVIYGLFTIGLLFFLKPVLSLDLKVIKQTEKTEVLSKSVMGVATILVINLVAGLISSLLSTLFSIPTEISANQLAINRELSSTFGFLILLTAVVFAPVVEELVFRKAFFGLIKNQYTALAVSSVVFGLIHVTTEIFQGNFALALVSGITYIAGGVSLGLIYISNKKNIFIPIFAHALYNLLGMLLQLFS